ncbi:protein of unknown function [Xenorhabdus doucetiae]|uniref:Uncharacterized protein n=1 Tax=Xenorhabdus doucetiae TaxID=351671 RepID=A0A068QUT8_9GAMM|nr:protein of unknown function [Xenorhabdus doucetiae]
MNFIYILGLKIIKKEGYITLRNLFMNFNNYLLTNNNLINILYYGKSDGLLLICVELSVFPDEYSKFLF